MIHLIIEPEESYFSIDHLRTNLNSLFMLKYKVVPLDKNSILGEGKDHVFIKGNLQIEILTTNSDVHVIYTDLIQEKEIKHLEKVESRETERSIIEDL